MNVHHSTNFEFFYLEAKFWKYFEDVGRAAFGIFEVLI
jgi:hypothetical protein